MKMISCSVFRPSAPELNGQIGIVQAFIEPYDRFVAQVVGSTQPIKAKPSNLLILARCPGRNCEISPSRWELEGFLRALKLPDGRRLPFIACLRNSQNYVRASARGLGVAEIAPSAVAHDLELWRPLLRWLNGPYALPD